MSIFSPLHQFHVARILLPMFLCVMLMPTWSVVTPNITQAAPANFVNKVGTQLVLNGAPFRFAGTNIYWLGLDEGARTYPTPFRVDDAYTVAREMGITVIRSHSLGVSTGCELCVEPRLGQFNETAFRHIDYAIKRAQDFGFKLIIPLTDNYHFYHGGKYNFTQWRGIQDENQFYYNQQVINDFKQYVNQIVNRVNSYTGVAYKNDPTIMAWETGNELLPPSSWTRIMGDYLKSIDSNHLVVDGNYGIDSTSLSIPSVDIFSDHLYPPSIERMNSDTTKTKNANKVFIIGEYDWQTTQGTALAPFLSAVANNPLVAGDMFWSIWPHDDTSGYYKGFGGINLTYPGDTADRRNRVQTIRAHGFQMKNQGVPASSTPGKPLITKLDKNKITWRGTTIADRYTIERSTVSDGGPWTVICDRCVTDYNSPWTDNSQPNPPVWYRIKGHNINGVPGPYSDVVGTARQTDNLDNWSKTYSHSPNIGLDSSNPDKFHGDRSRASRYQKYNIPSEIVWRISDLRTFMATAYFWPSEPVSHFLFYIGDDASNWIQVSPTIIINNGDWKEVQYSFKGTWNTRFVRIRWNNNEGQVWSPQLSSISYN